MAYISIDAGTSGCKACVMDERGNTLAFSRKSYSLCYPAPGRVELDPGAVLDAVFSALGELAPFAGDARAIAVSTIGEAFVPVDKRGNVLCRAMTYLDRRCEKELELISRSIDLKKLHGMTSVPLNEMYSLSKLLWLKNNEPELFSRIDKLPLMSGFISHALCGEYADDHTLASRTMLFDVRKLEWSDELMALFDMPRAAFSQTVPAGAPLGRLKKDVAASLGLSDSIIVCAGCHDQCAAALGSGGLDAGCITAGQGTTENLNVLISSAQLGDAKTLIENQLCFEPYVTGGLYSVMLGQLTYGACIKWFVDNFCGELKAECVKSGKSVYDLLDENCPENSGGVYFLPYLSGVNCMDVTSRALGAFVGLQLSANRFALYRALLEGLCFQSRKNLELLENIGCVPARMTASGGCTRSALLMQLKSDVLGLPIDLLGSSESGLTGLAMLCAVACGDSPDYHQAAKTFIKTGAHFTPERDYSAQYAAFKKTAEFAEQLHKAL